MGATEGLAGSNNSLATKQTEHGGNRDLSRVFVFRFVQRKEIEARDQPPQIPWPVSSDSSNRAGPADFRPSAISKRRRTKAAWAAESRFQHPGEIR
jgi:hypothetical protein